MINNKHMGSHIRHPRAAKEFFRAQLGHLQREVFAVMYLNVHFKVMAFEPMFYGTVNAVKVYPREVLRGAMQHNASHVILAHNHPSGQAMPSPDDRDLSLHLQQLLRWVDVTIYDHYVVTTAQVTSVFATYGLSYA